MEPIERLTAIFTRFPGIGPRQAERFVQYLLRSSQATRKELVELVEKLGGSVHRCSECMRYFSLAGQAGKDKVCNICSGKNRDSQYLAVVASDADLAALEKSGSYHGFYFVLGGTISLASEKTDNLHMRELLSSVPMRVKSGLKEIILALPANPEGDATGERVREDLAPLIEKHSLHITTLGRGLSTGSELEYADAETIKSAFANRK